MAKTPGDSDEFIAKLLLEKVRQATLASNFGSQQFILTTSLYKVDFIREKFPSLYYITF